MYSHHYYSRNTNGENNQQWNPPLFWIHQEGDEVETLHVKKF
jgi:hypothetical protein